MICKNILLITYFYEPVRIFEYSLIISSVSLNYE